MWNIDASVSRRVKELIDTESDEPDSIVARVGSAAWVSEGIELEAAQ